MALEEHAAARQALRNALNGSELLVAPGVFDCIGARAVARAGFACAYMTGAGTAAAAGFPDYGLLGLTEMADNAGRIAEAIDIPLIADADTGFGNELNVVRTVTEYERRGVAALHIEDQVFPKKCGHLNDKQIVPFDDFVRNIRAAAHARRDRDLVIIARTDARAVEGLESAIARANAALEAGADMAFVEAPESLEEVLAVPQRVNGPCLLNIVWNGKTPDMAFDEIAGAGYRMAILPGLLLGAAVSAFDRALDTVRENGRHPPLGRGSVRQGFSRFGADEWDAHRAAILAHDTTGA